MRKMTRGGGKRKAGLDHRKILCALEGRERGNFKGA